jgi:hypothetical protein
VDIPITVHAWDNEFYFQDDFKATSKLTLNYGLRYYIIRGGNGGAAVANNFSLFVPGVYDPPKAPGSSPTARSFRGRATR